MMSNPEGIDLNKIKTIVEEIPGVINIHHVHLWKLNDNDTHFEAHIEVNDVSVSETAVIQKQIEKKLQEMYEINHTTLQFECDNCEIKKLI
jgi:cobalt-zinc-cadmium efflux system protein